jgi:hypothetical protein
MSLMDADGQDDPNAIPELLDALDSGLDLATGRRGAQRPLHQALDIEALQLGHREDD